jgi:hypothetical protein
VERSPIEGEPSHMHHMHEKDKDKNVG